MKKKGEESNGITAIIELLIKDSDKQLTKAEFTEEDAQKDYKTFMCGSQPTRRVPRPICSSRPWS